MKKTKKGFTLVELVIVVAVMAVLVAVAIPTVSAITKSAQSSVDKTNAQTIESMLKLYQAENTDTEGATAAFTWTTDKIKSAIDNAKLGIETGTFYFDTDTGNVSTDATGAEFTITIANGIASAS